MDVVVHANRETYEEAKNMCDALLELMKDELDQARQESFTEALLDFLAALGEIPSDIVEMIQNEKDIDILKSYIPKAAMSKSIEEFRNLTTKSRERVK